MDGNDDHKKMVGIDVGDNHGMCSAARKMGQLFPETYNCRLVAFIVFKTIVVLFEQIQTAGTAANVG